MLADTELCKLAAVHPIGKVFSDQNFSEYHEVENSSKVHSSYHYLCMLGVIVKRIPVAVKEDSLLCFCWDR